MSEDSGTVPPPNTLVNLSPVWEDATVEMREGATFQANSGSTMTIAADTTFTADSTVTFATGSTTTFGGAVDLTAGATLPSTLSFTLAESATAPATVADSSVVYANSNGMPAAVTQNGAAVTISGSLQAVTTAVTVANTTTTTTLQSFTIPANDPQPGALYAIDGYGVFSTTGAPTLTFHLNYGGISGSTVVAMPAITTPTGSSNAAFTYEGFLQFYSTTQAVGLLHVTTATASSDQTIAYVMATPSALTATTTSAQAFAVTVAWGTADTSNTLTQLTGQVVRVA